MNQTEEFCILWHNNDYSLVYLSVCMYDANSCLDSLRYFVQERRWTQMLTSSVEEGSSPLPRYRHASVVVAIHDQASSTPTGTHHLMLVVGGVTPDSVMSDTWSLNLSSLMWTEHKVWNTR